MSKIIEKPVVAIWSEARENEWPVNLFLYHPLLSRTGAEVARLDLEKEMEKQLYNEYSAILAGLMGKELTVGVVKNGKPFLSHHTITSGGGIFGATRLSHNYRLLTSNQFSQIVKNKNPRISFVFGK